MFGAYWWKRLGEKKVCGFTVLNYALWGEGLLVFALGYTGFLMILNDMIRHPLSMMAGEMERNPAVSLLMAAVGASGIFFLTCASVALVRALIATLRFRKVFGFIPLTTSDGVKALQSAVDNDIRAKAKWLNEIYKKEQSLQEEMRLFSRLCGDNTSEELKLLVKTASSREVEIKRYRYMIPGARKGFYRARDVARAQFLPVPFEVKESFKDYLDGTIAATTLVMKEEK